MTTYHATTTGLFPLPDRAKTELSSLKGHQKEDLIDGTEGPAIVDCYDRARSTVIDLQQLAGLDRIVEGQLRWDDMLAHPLVLAGGVETGGIVRYYDNNNFYREPIVTDEVSPSGDLADELYATSRRLENDALQVVLPGPYSLADLATDEYYGDRTALLDATASLLAAELADAPAHETLVLLEPSLVTNPPDDGLDARTSEAIDTVAAVTDADVVVYPYWGALPEKVYAHLLDADIEAVGFDFVSDQDANLTNLLEYGGTEDALFGLVNGQNTLLEEPEAIRDRARWVLDRLPVTSFETVYLAPNTETFYLPYETFEAKIAALVEAAALAEVTPT